MFQVSTTVILVGGLTAASSLVDVFIPPIFYLLTATLLVCSAYGLFFQQYTTIISLSDLTYSSG